MNRNGKKESGKDDENRICTIRYKTYSEQMKDKSKRVSAIRRKSEIAKEICVAIGGETAVRHDRPLIGDRNMDARDALLGACVIDACTNTHTDTLRRVDGTSQLPLKGQIAVTVCFAR